MGDNTDNTGHTGNVMAAGFGFSGVVFADRADLPFVVVDDPTQGGNAKLKDLPHISLQEFPERDWLTTPYAMLALADFSRHPKLWTDTDPGHWSTHRSTSVTDEKEIEKLIEAAEDNRPDALAEILAQDSGFQAEFLHVLGVSATTHPATARLAAICGLIGAFVVMVWKHKHKRPRPFQLCPALRPPLPPPGHPSYPSGHATQAELIHLALAEAVKGSGGSAAGAAKRKAALWAMAKRIAENRETAGLHYASDTVGGYELAKKVFDLLPKSATQELKDIKGLPTQAGEHFAHKLVAAKAEWA
jgi:hypothetical protein